jgi:competence protein ComEC
MRYSEIIEGLRSAPFVRLLLPLSAGIIFQARLLALKPSAAYLCLALLLLMLLTHRYAVSYARRWWFGFLAFAFLFFAGVALVQNVKQQSDLPLAQKVNLLALVSDEPSAGANFTKLSLTVQAYEDTASVWHSVSEKILLYVRRDSVAPSLRFGDKLVVRVALSLLPPPKNPHEFDYSAYMRQRGVFASAFANSDSYAVVSRDNIPKWKIFPKEVRKSALAFFVQQGVVGEELAVLQALTLGDKSLLDSDLRQSYMAAGAMHILAVSGLHVGIISMILSFLLKPLERRRYGKLLRGVIVLLCIWSYALVAGFSASVLRAAIMFSVLTIGGMLNRRTNTYNTLTFSAFLLCLSDPLCLFDAGFQLSYAAVLSILFFQPRIYRLLTFKRWLPDAVWGLVAVSVAANIGTFPITIFLFQQFPLYFIVTNMLVNIPTILVMGGFLATLALCWIPHVGWLLAMGTNYSIVALNFCIRLVENLPSSLLEALWITPLQTWLLLLGITLASFFMWTKRSKLLMLALALLVVFAGLRAVSKFEQAQQKVMAVYSVKNASLITFVNGHRGFALCDSADFFNNFDFNVKAHLSKLGFAGLKSLDRIALRQASREELSGKNICSGFVAFSGKVVKILYDENRSKPQQPLPVDYLVLTSQCKLRPEQVLEIYHPQHFIIDASVSVRDAARFKRTLSEREIACHSVRDSGAFVQEF